MRVSLYDILDDVGSPSCGTIPSSARCALCQSEQSAVVRGPDFIACQHCGFVGDAIHYFVAHHKIGLEEGLSDLILRGWLDWDDADDETAYISGAKRQARIRELMAKGRDYYRAQNSTIRGLLETHTCSFSPGIAKTASIYHVALNPDMLEELGIAPPKEAKGAMTWWGKYSVLAIPAYVQWKVVGFWLIKPRDNRDIAVSHRFLLIDDTIPGRPVGYANALGVHHSHGIIVNNPIIALRMTMRQLADGPIIAPYIVSGHSDQLDPWVLGLTAPVFFPTHPSSQARVYFQAIKTLGAKSVWYANTTGAGPDALGYDPNERFGSTKADTSKAIIAELIHRALPAHEALGKYLVSERPSISRKVVMSNALTLAHQNQIMSYFDGDEKDQLEVLFGSDPRNRSVDIDGKIVTEHRDGWYAGNKLISDIMFTVDEVLTDATEGSHVAVGIVTYAGTTYRYEESFDTIRKNPSKWLEDFILRHNGVGVPYIASNWRKHILRIATKFKAPSRSAPHSRYGWQSNTDTLCFPCFSLNATTISMTESHVSGPMLAAPINIRSEEWSAWEDIEFAQLGIVLLMNLMQTKAGLPGRGILVTGGHHIVEKFASGMRCQVETNPRLSTIREVSLHPLPMPVAWSPDARSDYLRRRDDDTSHIIMTVPRDIFRLLKLRGGWFGLDVLDLPDEGALRTIFPVLQTLLGEGVLGTSDELVYEVGDAIATCLEEVGVNPQKMRDAVTELGLQGYSHPGNAATMIFSHMWWAIQNKKLTYADQGDLIVFEVEKIRRAFSVPGMPAISTRYIEAMLSRGNMLMENSGDRWGISKQLWNSYISLLSFSQR